jgi:membrane associated rhomboid family serine protease
MVSFIALLVVAGVAWRTMTKEQRQKALRTLDVAIAQVREHGREELERFRAALRARKRWAVVTFALAALNVAVFLWMVRGNGAQNGPLVAWGASVGPLTSNGEWWRLVTAIFINWRFFLLLVNVAALIHVGLTLERLVGSVAFGVAFFAAGIFSGLVGLSMYPTAVTAGPSGAILGLYGLLIVVSVALWRRRSDLAIPLAATERLAAIAVLFALTNLPDEGAGWIPQLAGLPVGILFGLAVAGDAAVRMTPPRRAATAAAAGLAIAVACTIPLRGILDVRPEIQRLVGVENRTAESYRTGAAQFKKGRMTAENLAELIDRTIVPELQAADARINTLRGVPVEDAPRLADAREYLRLRSESWRLRAEGLRLTARSVRGAAKSDSDSDTDFRIRAQTLYQSTTAALGRADGAERASLEAFNRLQH